MRNLLQGWHFARLLRLVLGSIIIWNAVTAGDWPIAIIGTLLVLTAVGNVGCCGISRAQGNLKESVKTGLTEDIEYEEVS